MLMIYRRMVQCPKPANEYGYVCMRVCVCVCVDHIFSIHPLMDTQGCFHVLATVNSAAMNMGCMDLFKSVFCFFTYMPRSEPAGSYGSPIFSFIGISILFSIVVVPIYIPTNSVRGFPLLHTLSSIHYQITFKCNLVASPPFC